LTERRRRRSLTPLVDHWLHRTTAVRLYIVGGAVLAGAVLMSAGDLGTPYY